MENHPFKTDLELTLKVEMEDAVDKAREEAMTRSANRMVMPYLFAVKKFGEILSNRIPFIYEKINCYVINPEHESYLGQRMLMYIDECFASLDERLEKYRLRDGVDKVGQDRIKARRIIEESIVSGNNSLKDRFRKEIEIKQKTEHKEKNIQGSARQAFKTEDTTFKLPTVFISYNWSNSTFADEIEASLSNKAEVRRDRNSIKPWGSISDFMKSIRQQDFAVLIISADYLKSDACLYEVVQLMKDDAWDHKTMYAVMNDSDVYDPIGRSTYLRFWNDRCIALSDQIASLPPEICIHISEDLRKAREISLNIGALMSKISDSSNPPIDNVIAVIQERVVANTVKSPYVTDISSTPQLFEVTKNGNDLADQIKEQMGDRQCVCTRCSYSGPSKYDNICPVCGFASDDD